MIEENKDDVKKGYILSKEAAEEQLDLFLDYYGIDLEDEDDKDVLRANRSTKKKIIRAIRKGLIEVKELDDTIEVHQKLVKTYPRLESPIKYFEPTGRSKIGMKDSENTDVFGKIYALLAGMSKEGKEKFLNLKGVDLSVAESLGLLFLDI